MKQRLLWISTLILLIAFPAMGQKAVRAQTRKANKLFEKKEYTKAEIEYRKALELNPTDKVAQYNLANTLLRTERGEEAGKVYQELLKEKGSLTAPQVADLAHNTGNLMMATKQYAEAVECYKEALRNRPQDEETRYNLALAQKLLQQQQQQGSGENQDQNEQDENKQQQQENQQEQKQPPQEPKEDNQKENREQQENQPTREQLSKDNAEKILKAYLQDEKETQRKVEQIKQQQKQKQRQKKNW